MVSRSLIVLLTFFFVACSFFTIEAEDSEPTARVNNTRVHWVSSPCRAHLPIQTRVSSAPLDSTQIDVLSWNIAKGGQGGWREDLNRLAKGKELVLLQEALLDNGFQSAVGNNSSDFSPGYRTASYTSGVMTAASVTPLSTCSFETTEPYLTTPKMALITEYPLKHSNRTLLVANIHAVNFTLGLTELSAQLQQISARLESHQGPIIFSGDFNTWREGRMLLVKAVIGELGLVSAPFSNDQRRQAFGLPLDHLFFRGLTLIESRCESVSSSDHNPIIVSLRL